MKPIVLIFSVAVCLLLQSYSALACGCGVVSDDASAEEITADITKKFNNATAVFVGEVVELNVLKVKFKLDKLWKGEAIDEITMLAIENAQVFSSCDYKFALGEKYLVYAYGPVEELKTHACSRTRPARYAERDMRELEEIKQKEGE